MNRRNFLAGLGALVGGLAIEQAIPLGRVWSFPSEIKPRALQFHPWPFLLPPNFVPGDLITVGNSPDVYIVVGDTVAGNDERKLMAYKQTPDKGKAYQIGFIPEKLARRFPFQHSGEIGTLYGFDTA